MGIYTGAWRPKVNRPAAGGLVYRRFAPESKRAFGRWGYTAASRPEENRPAAVGEVHGRFAPESKPACGRWGVHGRKNNNYLKIRLFAKIRHLGRNSKIRSGEDTPRCLEVLHTKFHDAPTNSKKIYF